MILSNICFWIITRPLTETAVGTVIIEFDTRWSRIVMKMAVLCKYVLLRWYSCKWGLFGTPLYTFCCSKLINPLWFISTVSIWKGLVLIRSTSLLLFTLSKLSENCHFAYILQDKNNCWSWQSVGQCTSSRFYQKYNSRYPCWWCQQ